MLPICLRMGLKLVPDEQSLEQIISYAVDAVYKVASQLGFSFFKLPDLLFHVPS